MTGHTQHTDLIDSYLSGSMDTSEESSFMDLIETDPILKEEFLFQQAIVGGLKEYRKNELKNRLSSISVGIGILGFILNSTSYKVMAAVLTMGFIGYGGYFAYNELMEDEFAASETLVKGSVIADFPQLNSINIKLPNFIESLEIENNSKDNSNDVSIAKKNSKDGKSNLIVVAAKKPSEIREDLENSKPVNYIPDFDVPEIDESLLADESVQTLNIDPLRSNDLNYSDKTEKSKIEIEHVRKGNKTLQYKFEEGKLYLYGDYGSDPYELLEINSSGKRTLYFYHDKQYYKLNQYQKSVTSLDYIEDKLLVKELEIIRTSK